MQSPSQRAVFFDRDGVLNPMVEYPQWGLDSPISPADFNLYPDAAPGIRDVRAAGYLAILVSNQPGIAKAKYLPEAFEAINIRLTKLLEQADTCLDGRYYCLHHPLASVSEYKLECDCRKPLPGLITVAARDFDIDLGNSFLIGDTIRDLQAAKAAGCEPILLQRATSNAPSNVPDSVRSVKRIDEAVDYICGRVRDVA